jgi:acyl-coenzyme A thioesterase PaaI-like protein
VTTAHEQWFPPEPPASPRRLRKHALADDVRQLIADVLMLDVENAPEAALAEAEEKLSAARKAIAALPDVRNVGLFVGDDSSLFERSPLSGRSNALAAPLHLQFEGELTKGHATYSDIYEGPPGMVHGGYVISAFDDLLGVAQAASGIAGRTGTLEVKLRSGTPLNQRIDYEAGVLESSGRKVIAWGKSYWNDTLCAEATGIFIVPRGGLMETLQDKDDVPPRAS